MSDDIMEERPVPGFHGSVERNGDTFIVSYALQDVYDIAVNSMDFGSGFLSTDEVRQLRTLGMAIGAEPLHYNCHKGWGNPKRPCDCGAEDAAREISALKQ